jgi:hypothetical protein
MMMMMTTTTIRSVQTVTKKSIKPFLLAVVTVLVALFLLPSLAHASIIERNQPTTATTFNSTAGYTTENGVYTGSVKAWGNRGAAHHTGSEAALKNQLMLSNKGLEVGGTTHSPVKKLIFSLAGTPAPAGFVRLELEGLYGVSTAEAHALGQQASEYVSSPTTLKINGVRFQHFTLNTADTLVVDIPASMLKPQGFNIIQLEAGYFFDENEALAYDEVSTGSIHLSY